MELLYKFNYKYDKDTIELKEHNKELSDSVKRMEEKYDRDTRELKTELIEVKTELKRIEEKDKVINPTSPNKLHRLVILQNNNLNSFRTLRVQAKGLDRELDKIKTITESSLTPTSLTSFLVLIV